MDTVRNLIRDPLRYSTKDTCFNPMLILSVLFDDRGVLSTRDKIVGPIVSHTQRYHCMSYPGGGHLIGSNIPCVS